MTKNSVNSNKSINQFLSTSSVSVFTTTTPIPRDNTIPQNTEGDQIFTLAITPYSASSTLVIDFTSQDSVLANNFSAALFQDSTANALAAVNFRSQANAGGELILKHVMTSGTTSSTTFAIRVGPGSATNNYLNADGAGTRLMGGVSLSSLTITEYLA